MKVHRWFSLASLAATLLPALALPSLRSMPKRASSPFVQVDGASFSANGSKFKYVGTNAYWLPVLNNDMDIWNTLSSISAIGAKVVRIWAFNDVATIPENGTWFQLVQNGTLTINEGPNGLQRLDAIVKMAEQQGLFVMMTLTNNWYPQSSVGAPLQARGSSSVSLPRNYLSNDYGGMDLYVSEFGGTHHDQFYTDNSVLNAFKNFTSQIVSRYVNSPAIFSWELANDARCNSTVPSSSSCTTQTVTKWHATMAQHIRSIDPNHLISAGTQGFICTDCPKLYPLNPAPTPQPSPAPGQKKRTTPLTSESILRKRAESWRLNRQAAKRAGILKEDGIRVRGRWVSTGTKRQLSQSPGPVYDGSFGVDSQDIMNIPDIGFGTFQLFPDQMSYSPADPSLSTFENALNEGNEWIMNQALSANVVGKPTVMTAFGLVTQDNAPDFVPFNMTTALYATNYALRVRASVQGVTNDQQVTAYTSWLNTSILQGIAGMIQYQWGQKNLTAQTGTTIEPSVTGISPSNSTTGVAPTNNSTSGVSPNDGYSISTSNNVQGVLQSTSQHISS